MRPPHVNPMWPCGTCWSLWECALLCIPNGSVSSTGYILDTWWTHWEIGNILNVISISLQKWSHWKYILNLAIGHIWITFWACSACNQHVLPIAKMWSHGVGAFWMCKIFNRRAHFGWGSENVQNVSQFPTAGHIVVTWWGNIQNVPNF